MWKRALAGAFFPLLLALGGCAWLPWLGPPRHFPEEVLPGWGREVEAPFYVGGLPAGASGALGAVWGQGEAWLWAEVISFPDQTAAQREFAGELAALPEAEGSGLGDGGATLIHPPSGLALEITRLGRFLLLVGSLAASSAEAPAPEEVRRAARVLLRRLPEVPPAEEGPLPEATCRPPEETPSLRVIQLPLSLDGQDNGTLTPILEVVPVGEEAGLCRYRFDLYLKCIELGQEDGDPGLRGPGDLFLAGSVALPCGELDFLTGEVAELPAGACLEFPDKGVPIASRECLAPCGLQNLLINLNLILRNHNQVNLLDLMAAFFWSLARVQPQAQPLWETAEQLSRDFGPEPGEPEAPEAAAG